MLAREAKVVLLEGPKKGEENFKHSTIREVNTQTNTIAEALEANTLAPKASTDKEEDDQKVLGASSVFDVFGDLPV